MSARRVTARIQAMSQRFSESGTSVRFRLDQTTLEALLALLSHSLQATITGHDFKPRIFSRVDADGEEGTDLRENIRNGLFTTASCELEGPVSAQQVVQLVTDVLEMPTDLMLVREHQVATPLLTPHADFHLTRSCQFPDLHLVSRHSGASSRQRPHCCARHETPKPNLHSHQRGLGCLLLARLPHRASARSTQRRTPKQAGSAVRARRTDWAHPQPFHLGPPSRERENVTSALLHRTGLPQ